MKFFAASTLAIWVSVSAWADLARPRIAIRATVAKKAAHQATLITCAS